MNAANKQARTIQFYYTGNPQTAFGRFGTVTVIDQDARLYLLRVSTSYDFDAVVRYIREWNRQAVE